MEIATCGVATGGVTVHVVDSEDHPVTGAEVAYQAGHGARSQSSTEAAGEATLNGLSQGTATLYAYKSGYNPTTGHVTVNAAGEGETTITLEAGQAVGVSTTSQQLTPAEIEAAGINPAEPGNSVVYQFTTKLGFGDPEAAGGTPPTLNCYLNAAGQFVGTCTGGGGTGGIGGGAPWSCSATGCFASTGVGSGDFGDDSGGGEIWVGPVEPPGGGGSPPPPGSPPVPAVQWLILHGDVSMLKQFLEVSMGVDQPFTRRTIRTDPQHGDAEPARGVEPRSDPHTPVADARRWGTQTTGKLERELDRPR